MTTNRELKFLTRRIPLQFEGDQAMTTFDVEKLKNEMQDSYELAGNRPIALSMTDHYLLVTFEVYDKREASRIGF
ncbi:MAG: hypothetical protein H7Z75_21445 [Ferruginibacter sp.]|nr:hypothetical protein [Cytophagales bacterium]